MTDHTVGVVGAAGFVGQAVTTELVRRELTPIGYSRQQRHGNFVWETLKDGSSMNVPLWIDVGPIWEFSDRRNDILRRRAKKIVITSSTSKFTKSALGSSKENDLARKLEQGEADFIRWCESKDIDWVILRPTLIYGMGQDRNVREIAAMIKRFGMFPIFGRGTGMRQPVHALDLGKACVDALLSAKAKNKAYNISGAEILPYHEMVTRIFMVLGRRPVMPRIPLLAFRMATTLLRFFPRFAHWTPEMAERMNNDMIFDHSEAMEDFGFSPQPFSPKRHELE